MLNVQTSNYYYFPFYSILLRVELAVYRFARLLAVGELSGVWYSGDGL
jgi:hypothetical protein